MAPPYVDEDPNLELTRRGLRVAENEKRDSMTEEYERQAVAGDNTDEALDDIAYPEGGETRHENPEPSVVRGDPPSEK